MDNPNESILLTDDGHPIGEVVVADNASMPPMVPEATPAESREAVLKAVASELTGDPDADKAVAELYVGYADASVPVFLAEGVRSVTYQIWNTGRIGFSGDTATEHLRKVSAAGLTMMHKPLKAVRLRALLNHEFAKRIA